jgi:hypothetical protein
MNSPWDPISVGSSRRSSMVDGAASAAVLTGSSPSAAAPISQHISRLQRKAQQQALKSTSSLASSSLQATTTDGRQSALSDCTVESPGQQEFATPRRASDPVRTLDRNFGVGGQMSRHRSYTQLNQQRMPLHGLGDGENRVRTTFSF